MKEIRRIKFTDKNLNDVFALPCVKKIIKISHQPMLVIYPHLLVGNPLFDVVTIGDELVGYDNGMWKIVKNEE